MSILNTREKLIELQLEADIADNISENATQHREFIADFMIANGVTLVIHTKQGPVYGDYIRCRKDQISEAKELLLEQMVVAIRELAKKDDFFEVNELSNTETAENIKVSWKFSIPHMKA